MNETSMTFIFGLFFFFCVCLFLSFHLLLSVIPLIIWWWTVLQCLGFPYKEWHKELEYQRFWVTAGSGFGVTPPQFVNVNGCCERVWLVCRFKEGLFWAIFICRSPQAGIVNLEWDSLWNKTEVRGGFMQTVLLNMAVHEGSCLCGWISTIGNNLPVGLKNV